VKWTRLLRCKRLTLLVVVLATLVSSFVVDVDQDQGIL
jgi:hypothetical protein